MAYHPAAIIRWLAIVLGLTVCGWLTASAQQSGQQGLLPDYATTVRSLLMEEAKQVSSAVSKAGFIPEESFQNPAVRLEGRSVEPSGNVEATACQYAFRNGALSDIRRKDLFEDKGPDSLILHHLTNEVLALKPADAGDRALEVLRLLSFDVDRVRKACRIQVKDDLMDAHPVRNGGPNFPRDLHFFGELISRKKIRIIVEFIPIDTQALTNSRSDGGMRIEFLATTGELLSARFADPDVLAKLGVPATRRLTVHESSDFTPPTYISVSRKPETIGAVSSSAASALLASAWSDLLQKLGTNQPQCYLLCDNLNAPEILKDFGKLANQTPWVRISHVWRDDLPFDRIQMNRLARQGRGLSLLAVCGKVETQFETITGLEPIAFPGNDEAAKQRFAQDRAKLLPKISEFLNRMPLPQSVPDHALFLLQSDGGFSSRVVFDELQNHLRDRTEVFDAASMRSSMPVGAGVTYLNGEILTNAALIMRLSGHLPLRMDTMSLLRRQPERRMISWEVCNPVAELVSSFGPNPMEEIFDRLGQDGAGVLQNADRVEVFRIKSNTPDDWSIEGRPNIDGYEIIRQSKQQGQEFARQLASVVLNENISFGGLMKSCIWSPGVVFRAWHGKESATLIVCFQCDSAQMTIKNAAGQSIVAAGFDFDRNHEALLKLAQKAFPSDSALKKLSRSN